MGLRTLSACTLLGVLGLAGCARARPPVSPPEASITGPSAPLPVTAAPSPPAPSRVDFDTRIRPLLDPACKPCHFEGGTMYARLPFDRPDTIRRLGSRLFTRISDPDDQALIRAFLDQPSDSDQPPGDAPEGRDNGS